ncbi:MAG: immunoglobulin domain-containing protein [Sedimentisphaerales bacterium]|nr:immunoglobulin domain-containing protein [Sedimentisphaerales bacterium]
MSRASIVGPYEVDKWALHIWHLDEPAASATVADAVASQPLTLNVTGAPVLGSPSFAKFGTSILTGNNNYLSGGVLSLSRFTWSDGAFTFEAIIRPDVNPLAAPNNMNIICGERAGSDPRSWQFRITNAGQLHFIRLPTNGAIENFNAPLPSSGPNAAVAGQWYHVAVTYTGVPAQAGNLKLFWTLLDESRTEAALLAQFTMNTGLGGELLFTIGTSGRNPGGEGFRGLIDEVRISGIDRYADEMQFSDKGGGIAPKFTVQPADLLAGFGEPVKLQAMASGTLPITYQWQFNGANLPGEVNDVLAIPAATFEQEGTYKVIATNGYGSATSQEAKLTVGALFSELFNTGQDVNLAVLPGGSTDLHYGLLESPDANNLGPRATVWSDDYPVPVFVYNGPVSSWISAVGNAGIVPGRYVYRTQFLIDSADPCTAVIEGSWMLNTTGDDILLNGLSTGITNASELPYKVAESFTIDKGFVAGLNTLDFVVTNSGVTPPNLSASYTGLRVQLRGVGKALAAGVPQIVTQPQSRAVRIGGKTALSVVASGRPPLSYKWLFNGKPMTDPNAVRRTLPLNSVSAATAGSYTVVVTNSSGSLTSDAAVVTAVPENHAPEAIPYKTTTVQDQPLEIPVSRLRWNISDSDGDPTYFTSVSPTSDAGGTIVDLGGASITYVPPVGFTGQDRFTYSIEDEGGATAVGEVLVEVVQQ